MTTETNISSQLTKGVLLEFDFDTPADIISFLHTQAKANNIKKATQYYVSIKYMHPVKCTAGFCIGANYFTGHNILTTDRYRKFIHNITKNLLKDNKGKGGFQLTIFRD
jgi:hypothetical protein